MNNLYISASRLGFDPYTYISNIPPQLVHEIHLAGSDTTIINQQEIGTDSYNRSIAPVVWDLYGHAIKHLGTKPTIIEWDNQPPSLEILCSEAFRAEKMMRETYVTRKLTG
jgi:uncharacterized protein (UPF0276 family)